MLKTAFLSLAAVLYRVGLHIDKFIKSSSAKTLPCPVVSIGNLTVGGAGKTPLLIRLVNDLKMSGIRPSVLTRGYRSLSHSTISNSFIIGKPNDETLLMAEHCPQIPIAAGADRVGNAQKIFDAHPVDIFVLDDGFQHWPIRRDWDFVCIDMTDPWGGGALLPQGRLREEIKALERADVVVLTRCELASLESINDVSNKIKEIKKDLMILRSRFDIEFWDPLSARVFLKEQLKDDHVLAFCAVGNPGSFEKCLINTGLRVQSINFRDHHEYSMKDLERINRQKTSHVQTTVTTEKDWVKIKHFYESGSAHFTPPLVVKQKIKFLEPDDVEWNRWVHKCSKRKL